MDLTIPDTTPPSAEEVAALIEGLAKARAAGPTMLRAKMAGRAVVPLECRLTPDQWAALTLSKHGAALFCGRSVSSTLLVRRALELYTGHITQLLRDGDARAQDD